MAGIPEEPQPAPNVARQASLAPTDVSDVEMEVEYTHHDANPFEGQSQDRQSAPPCTPQGLQPTLSYLTPPDTTSPLSRHSTRARFPQPNFTPQEAPPLGSTSYDMEDAAGVGTSNAAGPSGAQPRAASGSTVIEGLADRVTHIMEEMREESRRTDVAMQEKSVLLQQMRVQLQEKDAALLQKDGALVQKDGELHTANASLVAHREREEVLEDRLDATVLMHADALAQLDDAMGEKDALVGQHHDLHMKHWAAQAASKCSVVLNEKRGTALENNMLAGIRGVVSGTTYSPCDERRILTLLCCTFQLGQYRCVLSSKFISIKSDFLPPGSGKRCTRCVRASVCLCSRISLCPPPVSRHAIALVYLYLVSYMRVYVDNMAIIFPFSMSSWCYGFVHATSH
ncbi:hypothetical protein LXA43DRAFT_216935 [Ganoderma leucocontextum]|nr:hypothetical protein LXA43DRAFT_216935 [Ganoderma leucocontextum]